ncbi:MAG TPA: hypothetical protein VJK49_01240, partial [Candidatus Limnocylindrales bacterium]|nr:hypothetical protein [Candidatus Limnocylindrales bacterium]
MVDLSSFALFTGGFRDGLGERLIGFDRAAGERLELLQVRPELAAHAPALRERVEILAAFDDQRFLRVRGFAVDPSSGRPLIVSESVEGD